MPPDLDPSAEFGHVLVVCTGNVCRSPYIERLLARELAATGIVVSSAGTGALVGAPIDAQSASRIAAAGADPEGFVARQLTREIVASADLIISATREHLASVVPLHPRALRYSFALHDLRDLLAAVSDWDITETPGQNRVAKVAAVAISRRGIVHPRLPETSGITDPYRREASAFDQMVQEVGTSLPTVVTALRGTRIA
jgi:protein-tyrosine phosphatase